MTLATARAFLRYRYGRRPKTRSALRRWQERRVRQHLGRLKAESPFLHRWMEEHIAGDIRRWRELPTMDKARMMDVFSELNTAGVDRDEALRLALRADRSRDFRPTLQGYTVGLSSGTTGHRGLFLSSPEENERFAGVALAKMLPGSPLALQRIALCHRANSHLYENLGSGRLQLRYFDLLGPFGPLLRALEGFAPTILIAPPSALRLFAEAVQAGELRIASPKRLISVAEVLDPLDEAVIAAGLGAPIHVAYIATEGFVAATCPLGSLHLNEDLLIVEKEWLDYNARTFIPILTDLNRETVPVVRYRLDDVLTLATRPCPCGSVHQTLERVQGRSDDIFLVGAIPIFPDALRRAVLQVPSVGAYELVQTGPRNALATLWPRDDAPSEEALAEALRVSVSRALRRAGAPPLELAVRFQASRPTKPVPEKTRRVRRDWSPDAAR